MPQKREAILKTRAKHNLKLTQSFHWVRQIYPSRQVVLQQINRVRGVSQPAHGSGMLLNRPSMRKWFRRKYCEHSKESSAISSIAAKTKKKARNWNLKDVLNSQPAGRVLRHEECVRPSQSCSSLHCLLTATQVWQISFLFDSDISNRSVWIIPLKMLLAFQC